MKVRTNTSQCVVDYLSQNDFAFVIRYVGSVAYPSSDDSFGPTQGQPFATFGPYALQGCSPEKPEARAIADPRNLKDPFYNNY
jgi:hypothetical protein